MYSGKVGVWESTRYMTRIKGITNLLAKKFGAGESVE